VTEFAKIVNYSRQHISAVVHGTLKPGRKVAEAIEKATNGEIKAKELLKQ
jgi:DNA-binding transcriptional regulator YdaS (Cro superfamily)